jgi:hypothetical protein
MNPQVESPHEGAVHLLVFQPMAPAAHPREVSLLTCGQDGRAKVWSGGEASWNCRLCIGIYYLRGSVFLPLKDVFWPQ